MMKIGIFFGGQSREREISFAGGRTVYDNLDKTLFEAIPIFVDSLGHFILLDWQFIYKGTIRDFYPPAALLVKKTHNFQIYVESVDATESPIEPLIDQIGKIIEPHEFKSLIDFAFLALHGPYGEDGNIQGLLEWYGIPYSGSGILASAIGINKVAQKRLMKQAGFAGPNTKILSKSYLKNTDINLLFNDLQHHLGLPFVVKAPSQGSSIGVSVVSRLSDLESAIHKSLFITTLWSENWLNYSAEDKYNWIRDLVDIRTGIGLPVRINETVIAHPSDLLEYINNIFITGSSKSLSIEAVETEDQVLFESFIAGKEFSCIVLQDNEGQAIALPPTEIVKGNQLFDYRSKYLPGMSRKVTPIDLPTEQIEKIRAEAVRLFDSLGFNVYARIDGFVTPEGEVFLNDPNTTSGMLPSSFFFHQAAEIGLNPSQFLTYIIRTSLAQRHKTGKNSLTIAHLLQSLDQQILNLKTQPLKKIKVAVIMGGYSSERHISVESGRNIYEKLASSTKYEPIPVFLTGNDEQHELYLIPINVMLKDNADDIKEKVLHLAKPRHELLTKISTETKHITQQFASDTGFTPKLISYQELANLVDEVFIALHGRPGEDGALQRHLEKHGLTYNGSGIKSSSITINKFETNKILRENGILVANHRLVYSEDWLKKAQTITEIEEHFNYPFIAKPADDGCSSAVKKIKNRAELEAFANMMFRETVEFLPEETKILQLKYNEEFPQKRYFLIEDLIDKNGAKHFLEITGGMLTKFDDQTIVYEVFEPSETLATGEVLSLEEKFLAGEGQNITPARFSILPTEQALISQLVRATLEKAAKVLQVEGYCRIDAFVRIYEDLRVETVIIEINSLPGMTPATCIFHQSALNGHKPYEFIDSILTYGQSRISLQVGA